MKKITYRIKSPLGVESEVFGESDGILAIRKNDVGHYVIDHIATGARIETYYSRKCARAVVVFLLKYYGPGLSEMTSVDAKSTRKVFGQHTAEIGSLLRHAKYAEIKNLDDLEKKIGVYSNLREIIK